MFFEDSSAVEALPHNFKISWENILNVSYYQASPSTALFTNKFSFHKQGMNTPVA